MMIHGEDAYPGILDEFTEPLPPGMQNELSQIEKRKRREILILLNAFISQKLCETTIMPPRYSINECLVEFDDEFEDLGLPDSFELRHSAAVAAALIELDFQKN
ncbi:uncharacterized protein LOC142349839 [Convolutriloba macropyga]|uniref:uncharacterized protein LOC142349839 n=1 Tax=Convolutriloba macropyga TaxID=536237 RepID=UPI003F5217D4